MRSVYPTVGILFAVLATAPISGQDRTGPATLTHAEGDVYVDARPIASPSGRLELTDSMVIRTAEGRAAIALKGGGILALDHHTAVRVLSNGAYNFNRIAILEGTAVVISDTSTPSVSCARDVRLSTGGVFRFDREATGTAGGPRCRFRVQDGAAAVPLVSVTSALRSGQTMTLDPTCGDMIPVRAFAPDALDDFDRWSREQAVGRQR